MYDYITGKLGYIYPTYICIDHQGLGYKILTPNPFQWQENLHQEITCYLEFVVREDSHTLYGFSTREERELFMTLNKVSGIGPKSALSILAGGDHLALIQAIEQGDIQYLTKYPGVGKKTAQQMVLDLSGKLQTFTDNPTEISHQDQGIFENVYDALLGLGYSAREIDKIKKRLEAESISNTQEGLSFAFKLLLKK